MKIPSVEKQARRILEKHGGTINRPVEGFADLHLAWIRQRPKLNTQVSQPPVVVLPGGPGISSVFQYRGFRRQAMRAGLDVVMMEHRGIGLSGHLVDGRKIPPHQVSVIQAADDLAAVLDHLCIERAIISGSSYGSYLAQSFAVRHPDRVHTLVLDSPMFSVMEDLESSRAYRRELFLEVNAPIARHLRTLDDAHLPPEQLSHIVQVVYEFAGAEPLLRLLQARHRGKARWLWKLLASSGTSELDGEGVPFMMEPEPVEQITWAELGYGLPADGRPMDPAHSFAKVAFTKPQYSGEPHSFPELASTYHWPTVVLSGERDLRTPRPVAQRIVDLVPQGYLVALPETGHSALDVHALALIEVLTAATQGNIAQLPTRGAELAALKRRGIAAWVGPVLAQAIRLASIT